MGARPVDEPGHALEAPDGLKPASIYLVRSVGDRHRDGAARRGRGARAHREIRHAACEPHVVELCEFLQQMGVGIDRRRARRRIRVEGGGEAARRASTGSGGDYIEAGSWAVVAAITGGEIDVTRRARRGHGSGRARC